MYNEYVTDYEWEDIINEYSQSDALTNEFDHYVQESVGLAIAAGLGCAGILGIIITAIVKMVGSSSSGSGTSAAVAKAKSVIKEAKENEESEIAAENGEFDPATVAKVETTTAEIIEKVTTITKSIEKPEDIPKAMNAIYQVPGLAELMRTENELARRIREEYNKVNTLKQHRVAESNNVLMLPLKDAEEHIKAADDTGKRLKTSVAMLNKEKKRVERIERSMSNSSHVSKPTQRPAGKPANTSQLNKVATVVSALASETASVITGVLSGFKRKPNRRNPR